ncbi:PspC domain-containing protein [Streptomyces sp. XM4193]|uniref:PspC domain-containing protein n=1 Tax=Streptomyces sp. XM4193 TaxID=2929782 RepID=UPI001FF7F904|nr:PspC domain-containing protein [Streptomyces sp. XM4193]MCK1795512.1 PspC domain-containing protein [Streptomyces sp. XM4193]
MTQEHWGHDGPAGGSSAGGPSDGPAVPGGAEDRRGDASAHAGVGASGAGSAHTGGPTGAGARLGAGGDVGGRPRTGGEGGMWASRSGRGTDGASGTGGAGGTGGTGGGGGTGTGAADVFGTGGVDGAERLERSRQHKVLAGVCGGLGRHFDMDPVLFRVPVAVLSAMGGLGLLFYAFAWLLVPLEGEDENEAKRLLSGRVEGGALAAVLCALAGCGVALASLDNGKLLTFALMVTAALGAAAYWSQKTRGEKPELGADARPEAPPEPQAPPTPLAPSWWREPSHTDGYLWGPAGAEQTPPGAAWTEQQPTGGAAPVAPQDGGRRSPVSLGGGVFLAAVVSAVGGSAAVWSSQPLGTALVVGLTAALATFGLGLVVGAFTGRIGGGTIVSVVLTTLLLAGAASLPKDLTTTFSEQLWRPAAAGEVREHYRVGTGQGTLDLGGLRMKEDDTVVTSLRVAAGEARVVVPPNALVEVDVRVGLGGYDLPGVGSGQDGSGVSGGGFRVTESYTMGPLDGEEPAGTIELTVDVGAGGVTVERDMDAPVRTPGSEGDGGTDTGEETGTDPDAEPSGGPSAEPGSDPSAEAARVSSAGPVAGLGDRFGDGFGGGPVLAGRGQEERS